LKVLGLSPELTNEDLYVIDEVIKKLFAAEGSLEKCLIEQDNFGRSLATAIVKYHNTEAAKSAIHNLNRHKIMNCVLTVEPYKNTRPE
jgi:RNA recognition motif-containing protein